MQTETVTQDEHMRERLRELTKVLDVPMCHSIIFHAGSARALCTAAISTSSLEYAQSIVAELLQEVSGE